MDPNNHFAHAAMLIRRPIKDVFQAFIDPTITSKFWFTSGTEILESKGKSTWKWEMFNHEVEVMVLEIKENECIRIQWGNDPNAIVHWKFEQLAETKTFVEITNTGFTGVCDEIIRKVRDATGGFSWVLAGAKAYLEHKIELNLIKDRYPKQ